MGLRRLLGGLPVAAVVVSAWMACKDKGPAAGSPSSGSDLDKRCEQLGKVCSDTDKHIDKVVDECKQAAKKQVEDGCADKAIAVYDCEKALCGSGDKVWALDDLRVLADRHGKCVAERKAAGECTKK